jgi:uncharacterized protein Smg (DUF494 family)
MQSNVVDILLALMVHLQKGAQLNDFNAEESLKKFNRVEIGAAYSWLYNRFPELLKKGTLEAAQNADPTHRVLHMAEQMMIDREAYGYLLRLLYTGVIDIGTMEGVIERVMLQFNERITVDKLKELVAGILFDPESGKKNLYTTFKGNEKIH